MVDVAPLNIVEALSRALRWRGVWPKSPNLTKAVKTRPLVPKIYYRSPTLYETQDDKTKRIRRELLDAGMTIYGLLKSETRVLPKLLHPNEHVEAVIYGQHGPNSAMLAATNERIIYIDKKPMALLLDEVSYEVISGVEFDIHLLFASVTLHTPVKNYNFRMVNMRCAEKFARHIEMHRLEREGIKEPELELPTSQAPKKIIDLSPKWQEMAGYSWLPAEEEEEPQKVPLLS